MAVWMVLLLVPGQLVAADDFVLSPLPNHLYQRDNSAWVYDGVVLSRMAREARRRESVQSRAIYAFHPMFRGVDALFTALTARHLRS